MGSGQPPPPTAEHKECLLLYIRQPLQPGMIATGDNNRDSLGRAGPVVPAISAGNLDCFVSTNAVAVCENNPPIKS
jgi:hypothetical protein